MYQWIMYSLNQIAKQGLLKDSTGVPYTSPKHIGGALKVLGYSYTHPLGYNLTNKDLEIIQEYLWSQPKRIYRRNPKKWKTANKLLKYGTRT